jgi:hypothetical protein
MGDDSISGNESDSSEAVVIVDPVAVVEKPIARRTSTSLLPHTNASSSPATLRKKASKVSKPSQLAQSNTSSSKWDAVFEPYPESFKEYLYRQRRRTKLNIFKKLVY